MDKYYIVILNWKGWDDTQKCIESIISDNDSFDYSIVLVDNGSDAAEINKIELYCKDRFKNVLIGNKEVFLSKTREFAKDLETYYGKDSIIVIKNNENLGFAGGNNVALDFLSNLGKKYVLLLNNDTEVVGNALQKMYEELVKNERTNLVAVVPQIRYYEPADRIWNCGGSINWLGIRKYYYAFADINDVPQSGSSLIDYGTGCCIIFNLSKTGKLSDKFFLGEEDMEFAYRLRKNKFRMSCLYEAVILHKVGASRGKISEEKMGNMVYHYSLRLSNLKDQLSFPVWCLSFLLHYLNTFRLLRKENYYSFKKVNLMWRDVFNNVNNIKRFNRENFIEITNKKY